MLEHIPAEEDVGRRVEVAGDAITGMRDVIVRAPEHSQVLVVSDDAVLGGLTARNLRLRGLPAEADTLAQVLNTGWFPATATLQLLIVSLVVPERIALADLQWLVCQPWAVGVPRIFAIDRRVPLAQHLGALTSAPLVPPTDVGAIVAAARTVLGQPAPT